MKEVEEGAPRLELDEEVDVAARLVLAPGHGSEHRDRPPPVPPSKLGDLPAVLLNEQAARAHTNRVTPVTLVPTRRYPSPAGICRYAPEGELGPARRTRPTTARTQHLATTCVVKCSASPRAGPQRILPGACATRLASDLLGNL